MSKTPAKNMKITPEILVAFADGRLDAAQSDTIARALASDAALRDQLDGLLAVNKDVLEQAFGTLKSQAPLARLEAGLDLAVKEHATPTVRPQQTSHGGRRMAAGIAIGVICTGLGFAASKLPMFATTMTGPQLATSVATGDSRWRESVAVYQTLYTTSTLDHVSHDTAAVDKMLARLKRLSAIDLQRPDLSDLGLTFKRGQLLEFEGKPLVQLAYLTEQGKPVAICFLKDQRSDSPLKSEFRHGLEIAYWTSDQQPVMIVGDVNRARLHRVAKRLQAAME